MSRPEPYCDPYLPYTGGDAVRKQKIAAEAVAKSGKRWDAFYKSNQTNFFKDRHWVEAEWPEISSAASGVVLDVGCGVGNTMFPLMQVNAGLHFRAFDVSATAVQLVRDNADFDPSRIDVFVCDVTREPVPVADASCDFAIVVFVLSALTSESFQRVIDEIVRCLKPGGLLYIRDYAVGDVAQERFEATAAKNKLGDNLFLRRSDGTTSYFFDTDTVRSWFSEPSMCVEVEKCEVIERVVENRKQNVSMRRKFIQAVVRKRPAEF